MPRYFVKVRDGKRDRYIHWSTVVDAPIGVFDSLDAVKACVKEEWGSNGLVQMKDAFARLEKVGVSVVYHEDPRDAMSFNRAGPNESELTYEEIIARYCTGRKAGSR